MVDFRRHMNIGKEVRKCTIRAIKKTVYLKDPIGKDKHIELKKKISKNVVRFILNKSIKTNRNTPKI